MKLYISSYKLGNKAYILKKWIKDHNNKIMMITNARDGFPDNECKTKGILFDKMALQDLGFDVTLLSLHDYFDKPQKLSEDMKYSNAFFAIGGNTFILRQAMSLSGFDEYLKRNLYLEPFLYGGYSAGICVLAPSLKGLEFVDDPYADPYHSPINYTGIGLVDYLPVPHYRSDHPESVYIEDVISYLKTESYQIQNLT